MNAVIAIASAHQDHVANQVNPMRFSGTASIKASAKLSTVRIPKAKYRAGSSARNARGFHKSQNKLAASSMPVVAAQDNKRRRLVETVSALPEILLADNSVLVQTLEATDWALTHNYRPGPKTTEIVRAFRATALAACPNYSAIPVANIQANGCNPAIFHLDGFGMLCSSGTNGVAVMRGSLCTKQCKIGCCDSTRGDQPPVKQDKSSKAPAAFLSLEKFLGALVSANQISNDITPAIA